MHAAARRRWCPGYSLYDGPIVRQGNSIGEKFPKACCNDSYHPPREIFIGRDIPSFVPIKAKFDAGAISASLQQFPAGKKEPPPVFRGNYGCDLNQKTFVQPPTAGLCLSKIREMNMF